MADPTVPCNPRNPLRRPPPLAAFLEAGCSLVDTGVWLEGLAEVAFREVPLTPPMERARLAESRRRDAEELLELDEVALARQPTWKLQRYLTLELWSAELYENPGLAEQLRPALPPEVVRERQENFDYWRRPHPLEIRVPDLWWACQNCGATFDEGETEAVIVGDREGHSDLDYEIAYCRACIAIVAAVVNDPGVQP